MDLHNDKLLTHPTFGLLTPGLVSRGHQVEGNLKNVPMQENLQEEVAMDVDDGDDHGIEVDFDSLTEEERVDNSPETTAEFYAQIAKLNREIERMAPNSKAVEKLDDVEAKLADTEKEADIAQKDKNVCNQFNSVKQKRYCIDQVYEDLTKGKVSPMHILQSLYLV
ncbi:hypothetical protein F4604DRAFT_1691483 [Suillus subluteus]|nr:hypothetical protein F4604DRAFT_1691483 [Suillus subluteus]